MKIQLGFENVLMLIENAIKNGMAERALLLITDTLHQLKEGSKEDTYNIKKKTLDLVLDILREMETQEND